jgi:hypothetical protein
MTDEKGKALETGPEHPAGSDFMTDSTEYHHEPDKPARTRPEMPDEAALTEQDQEYADRAIPPLAQRLRHWHHWRTLGLVCALAGIFMLIGGRFGGSGRAMQVGAFIILAGAVVFTAGVIGGWVTRQRPLD